MFSKYGPFIPGTRLALLLVALVTFGGFAPASAQPQPTEIVFGALLDLTGDWSALGISSKAVLEIATKEINQELASSGSPVRFRVLVENTNLDSTIAQEKLRSLASQGVRIVIGPQASSEVRALKPIADAYGIILISQGSTAGSLAIPGDNVFRFVPDDRVETEALAPLIWEDGIRTLVTIGRDDIGNEGLQIAMKRNFEGKGGRVIDGPRYSATATDYGPSVQSLSARAKAAVEQNDPKTVGIYLTAFNEVVDLFHVAQSDPLLASLRWYGSDGVAELPSLVKDPHSAAFAAKVGYPNPNVGLDQSRRPRWQPLSDQVKAITGSAPDAFGLAAYDAFRVATQAYLATGGTNQTAWLREAITQVANGYDGLSGEMVLNEAGDRKFGDFAFWAIREVNGVLQWTIVAHYRADPSGGGSIVRAESFDERIAPNLVATATRE